MKVLVVSSAVAVVCCAHSLMAATYYKVGTDHTPENLGTLKFVPDARSRSVGVSLYAKPDGSVARITGTVIRSLFGLRSNHFEIVYKNDAGQIFEITTLGYGHGVGMSQYGAIQYAKIEGWDYKQILNHYYTGVEVR